MDLSQIWKSVLAELEVDLGKQNLGLYFKNSELLSLENGLAKIGFPNRAVATQADQRYYSAIQTSLQKTTNQSPLSLTFEVDDSLKAKGSQLPAEEVGPLFETPKEDKEATAQAIKKAGLRPDFTLEEFCVSTTNQLAFAAAQSVVQNPGKNYNPFFIWGGVGIGKTHLMQAIGHEILRKNPQAKVVYATSEQFTNEIVAGIRSKDTSAVKEKYRSASVLLIDDIQFLGGKDRAQEEFFHTFNALQQKEAQIIVTSDTKPADIKYLEDRLRSRFEGGMVADISEPDHELKTAICVQKAKIRGIDLSTKAAGVIASNVNNIRTLEGTLQKIIQIAQLKKIPVNEDLITEVLNLPATSNQQLATRLDGRLILDAICKFYDLPIKLIKSEKRDKPISQPRQILMYLLKENTTMTQEEIAAFIGKKDHTTVIHGVRKIESLLQTDNRVQSEISQLHSLLGLQNTP